MGPTPLDLNERRAPVVNCRALCPENQDYKTTQEEFP